MVAKAKRGYGQKSVVSYKKGKYTPKTYGLGKSIKTTIKYSSRGISLAPGPSGTASEHVFSANGCFDPDISGVGHQPSGFDELMVFFDHYVVLGAKMTVHFRSIDTTYAHMCYIRVSDRAILNSDAENVIENGRCTNKVIGVFAAGDGICKLTYSLNPAKFLGRKDPMSDSELKGNTASNPTEEAFFIIGASPDSAVDSTGVIAWVEIEYNIALIEPKVVPKS